MGFAPAHDVRGGCRSPQFVGVRIADAEAGEALGGRTIAIRQGRGRIQITDKSAILAVRLDIAMSADVPHGKRARNRASDLASESASVGIVQSRSVAHGHVGVAVRSRTSQRANQPADGEAVFVGRRNRSDRIAVGDRPTAQTRQTADHHHRARIRIVSSRNREASNAKAIDAAGQRAEQAQRIGGPGDGEVLDATATADKMASKNAHRIDRLIVQIDVGTKLEIRIGIG